nr:HAMP domain-containing sensor histidine kinase [Actinocatenispora rupis]
MGPRPAAPRGGIVWRSTLVTCLVALISVLVTAAVAVPLARSAALRADRHNLAEQADLATALLGPRVGQPVRSEALARRLRQYGLELSLVSDGRADRRWVPARVARAVSDGRAVDTTGVRGGHRILLAARPLADGTGVVLAQRAPGVLPAGAVLSLGLALLAGLVAGVVAGALLARRLSRPIRHAAGAARRLSAGDRTVRLPVEAPAEVAELSVALNGLAAALAESEGRQRDFLLSVSHELRTPLTAIRGYGEALADGVLPGSDQPPVREAGRTVLAEAGRLDRLVTDLLALARLSAQDFPIEVVDVDLVELAGAAVTAWRPRCAEAGVDLRAELPDHPVRLRTDPGRLRQVVDGLLENAFRVVPAGAPLVVAVRAPGTVEVRDGGPGLSDEDLAVAFERGRLYAKYRGVRPVGTGLGLALAARLVARLGGRITADHAAEGGSRFTVTF